MKLHKLTHDKKLYPNKWCGPSILSILTGATSEDCAMLIKKKFKRKYCKGTSWTQVSYVLKKHKLKVKHAFATLKSEHDEMMSSQDAYLRGFFGKRFTIEKKPPTLIKWYEWHRVKPKENECYLMAIGNHWMIENHGMMVDNHDPEGVMISDSRMKKARVTFAIKLSK